MILWYTINFHIANLQRKSWIYLLYHTLHLISIPVILLWYIDHRKTKKAQQQQDCCGEITNYGHDDACAFNCAHLFMFYVNIKTNILNTIKNEE